MKNSWVIGIIVVIVVILGGWAYASRNGSGSGMGEAVISIADASANIEGVSDVTMTASKAELYSQAHGWVTVDSKNNEFNLLTLKSEGRAELYGRANVPADTYSKVRMTISKVEVQAKSGAKMTAEVPNNQMEFAANVVVNANKTTEAKLDFLVDRSLYTASNGQYVFAPVIKFESKSNTDVNVSGDQTVTTSSGNLDSSATVGMDLGGSMKENFMLDSNTTIKIENGTIINTLLNTQGSASSTTNTNANGSVSSSTTHTNVNGSVNTNTNGGTNAGGSGSGNVNVQLY